MTDVDCADYAVCFTCNTGVEQAAYQLWKAGRSIEHDGTTDDQIALAVKALGFQAVGVRTKSKTVRTFARERRPGSFLVFTCDHVVAVIDGFVCDRTCNSDLQRIEKIWEII